MRILGVLITCWISVLAHAADNPRSYHSSGGEIDFYALGRPSFLKVHGIAKTLEGTIQSNHEVSGHFSIQLGDFKTGVGLRDRDLRKKVFEVDQYPVAELSFNSKTLKSGEKSDFVALLKIHGTEKPIHGEASFRMNREKASFEASFKILLTDFGMKPPEFAGLKIDNEVRVEVSGEASP